MEEAKMTKRIVLAAAGMAFAGGGGPVRSFIEKNYRLKK
jgi:hypothetical protein